MGRHIYRFVSENERVVDYTTSDMTDRAARRRAAAHIHNGDATAMDVFRAKKPPRKVYEYLLTTSDIVAMEHKLPFKKIYSVDLFSVRGLKG